MRLLKIVSSVGVALLGLLSLSALIASPIVQAAPRASIVPVTTTIQAAIDAAQDGDTISIPAGGYVESLTINKALTLTGAVGNATVIYAVPGQRVITATGHDLRLEQLVMLGGLADEDVGGGILINDGCLYLVHVVIAENKAYYGGGVFQGGTGCIEVIGSQIALNEVAVHGGGLYANGDAVVIDSIIMSNTAGQDGGGLMDWAGHVTLSGGVFRGNVSHRDGGGLALNNSFELSGTVFVNNTAARDGGGVFQWNSQQLVDIQQAQFERNTAARNGGGLSIARGATVTVSSTVFLSNTADSYTTTMAHGGGLYFDGPGLLQIDSSLFRANRAACDGCSSYNQGGGACVVTATGVLIRNSTFEYNSATLGGGADLRSQQSLLQNAEFRGNTAQKRGGGLFASGGVDIAQSRFISNTSGSSTGGVHLQLATARLTNTVIAHNQATTEGGGLYVEGTTLHAQHTSVISNTDTAITLDNGVYAISYDTTHASRLWLTNTLLAGNQLGVYAAPGATVTLHSTLYFNTQVPYLAHGYNASSTHDYYGDARLAADGYHLMAGSQACDRGTHSGVTLDIDGQPRPLGGYDIGADEACTLAYLPLIVR